MIWDSTNNKWLTTDQNNSSSLVVGITKGTLGTETTLSSGTIPIATGDNTLGNSLLTYSGNNLDYNLGKFQIDSLSGNTIIAGTLEVRTNGSDLTGGRSNVTFKNSNNIFGEVATTDTTDVLAGMLGYDATTGGLKFSTVIDGGTF
jgi:hypothetical protein